jgi:hypothetical protein
MLCSRVTTVLEGVVELERDQERQDLPEQRLKYGLGERVERTPQQSADHAQGRAEQGDQDDQSDEEGQNQRDRALEALVERENRPLRFQAVPSGGLDHSALRKSGGAGGYCSTNLVRSDVSLADAEPVVLRRPRLDPITDGRNSGREIKIGERRTGAHRWLMWNYALPAIQWS